VGRCDANAALRRKTLDPESSDRRLRGNDGVFAHTAVILADAGIQSFASNTIEKHRG